MPLTAQEKNAIAQGVLHETEVGIGAGLGLGVGGLAALAIPFFPIAAGVTALITKPSFPQGPDLSLLINPLLALERRGLEGRLSLNPFSPVSDVISVRDQDPHLQELVRNATIRKLLEGETFPEVQAVQQGFVTALEETAQERGFPETFDPSLRGGVFRETAESPLQFVEGDFLL